MSTVPPAPAPPAPHAPAPGTLPTDTPAITIVSHSNLFYWWPVWAVGFIMAILTFIDGSRSVVVPGDSKSYGSADVEIPGSTLKSRDVVVLEPGKTLPTDAGKPMDPKLHMSQKSSYGVIWSIVLLLVILITNVPMRGMWSVVVIIVVVLLSVIFALAGWWEHIFYYLSILDIRINAGGYLFISLILFGIWLATLLIFDRQMYMIFTSGQLRVCEEIGGGETAYDTTGMVVMKHRSDLFRHWILGLGSGDLVVRTAGANSHEFQLHNVLFVGRKLAMIEDMQRERPVVKG
jgi:hypothetical protein